MLRTNDIDLYGIKLLIKYQIHQMYKPLLNPGLGTE